MLPMMMMTGGFHSASVVASQIRHLTNGGARKAQSTMNSTEHAQLAQKINELGAVRGRVIKSRGEWVIVPSIQRAKRIEVPAPIVNLPPAQWGGGNPIVIEGKR